MTVSNSILPQTRSCLVVISCIHTTSLHVRRISPMDFDIMLIPLQNYGYGKLRLLRTSRKSSVFPTSRSKNSGPTHADPRSPSD